MCQLCCVIKNVVFTLGREKDIEITALIMKCCKFLLCVIYGTTCFGVCTILNFFWVNNYLIVLIVFKVERVYLCVCAVVMMRRRTMH